MTDFDALQDAVNAAAERLGAAAAVLVVKDPRGLHSLATTGIASHRDAILMLATASHMVLLGHDAAVMNGDAEADARAVAEDAMAGNAA